MLQWFHWRCRLHHETLTSPTYQNTIAPRRSWQLVQEQCGSFYAISRPSLARAFIWLEPDFLPQGERRECDLTTCASRAQEPQKQHLHTSRLSASCAAHPVTHSCAFHQYTSSFGMADEQVKETLQFVTHPRVDVRLLAWVSLHLFYIITSKSILDILRSSSPKLLLSLSANRDGRFSCHRRLRIGAPYGGRVAQDPHTCRVCIARRIEKPEGCPGVSKSRNRCRRRRCEGRLGSARESQ